MLRARLLHDRVAVERIEAEDRSIGGIIMPDTARTVDCG
jgi:co-chaperonin GroES (HSP10)